jgi:MFS family permease
VTTYREVVAVRVFRVVVLSRALSIAAQSLRILGLSVLVYAVSGSPLLGALAFGAGFLPQVFGGVLLGALADRVRPRRLVAIGYALDAATSAALALFDLPVAGCLVLVAAMAVLTPVCTGASGRLIAGALTGDAYVLGRSLFGMAASVAQLLGLAGGGAAIALVGPRHALLVAAGLEAVASLAVRLRLPAAVSTVEIGAPARSSLAGSRYLLGDPTIRRLMLAHWLPSAYATSAAALLVPYADDRGLRAGYAGLLLAATSVGMLAGNLLVGRFVAPAARERAVPWLAALLGVPLLFLVADPPVVLVLGLLVASGAGFAYQLGLQGRFLDAVPEPLRGQAFALLSTGLMSLQGLAPAFSGRLAELTSTGWAIAAGGVAVFTAVPLLAACGRPSRSPLGSTASLFR